MSEPLLVQREGGIAWLRFNRPERLNAIDAAMAVAFRDAVRGLPGDATLRCVVLAGEGRAFMAGGDITAFGNADAIATIMDPMHEALALLAALPVPVLASVQGAAAGGGMSIALAADLAIAADNAKFNLAYLRLGTSPDCGGSWNLARLVGLRRAMGIALLEEVLDAPAALAAGLVNRVVPAAELATATGLEEANVRLILERQPKTVPLDRPLGQDLEHLLDGLSQREATVIRLRFGLEDDTPTPWRRSAPIFSSRVNGCGRSKAGPCANCGIWIGAIACTTTLWPSIATADKGPQGR
jgi:2-(1,2-epoxy-1,2-dihydrophenyl)acetyl-CoA isomerase